MVLLVNYAQCRQHGIKYSSRTFWLLSCVCYEILPSSKIICVAHFRICINPIYHKFLFKTAGVNSFYLFVSRPKFAQPDSRSPKLLFWEGVWASDLRPSKNQAGYGSRRTNKIPVQSFIRYSLLLFKLHLLKKKGVTCLSGTNVGFLQRGHLK